MVTVKPGRVPGPNTGPLQAPHINVTLFARGMLNRVVTRVYFADEAEANANDQVLATVPAARRNTLLAQPTTDGYRFDIHLQGPGETVFFDMIPPSTAVRMHAGARNRLGSTPLSAGTWCLWSGRLSRVVVRNAGDQPSARLWIEPQELCRKRFLFNSRRRRQRVCDLGDESDARRACR